MKKTTKVVVIAVAVAVCLCLFATVATAGWYKWYRAPVVVVPPCPVVKYCGPVYCGPPVVGWCGPVYCRPPLFPALKYKRWLRGCWW
jgi:hypothetical protein